MVPVPFQQNAALFGRDEWGNDWGMKQPQLGPGMMMGNQPPENCNPWISAPSGWQGELGPNLMPQQAMQQNMQPMLPPPAENFFPGGPQQNMMGLGLPNTYIGQGGPGMNWDVQNSQLQPVHSMNNGQNPMMQVITLPAGAPPPQGAIPMGPMHGAEQEIAHQPPMMQMIAVPAGEAPPEGAILVDQFSTASTAASTPTPSECDSPVRRNNRALKIKDPRTGLEVGATGDETGGAPRRMRIVNPKTGMEVRPSL